ncbi:MAG TPA: chorismate-binding protein, partial [Actinomycetota bacterium]|nr:chorismate-binding protein [Actinomycetota bacterium]
MTGLAARATRLGPAFDLLAGYREGGFFLERSGLGLATSGEVDRVAAEAGPERILRLSRSILEALASIEGEPGGPSVAAVASIPFDDRQPAEAVLPRRATMRLDAGETWQVEIAPRGETPLAGERERWAGRTLPHDAFEEIQLRPDPEPDEYAAAVGRATERIRSGELRKVVLARTMLVNADRTLDPKQLLWRLRAV